MIPNYELFMHGFNTMPVGPEAPSLPLWVKLAYGGVAGFIATLAIFIG